MAGREDAKTGPIGEGGAGDLLGHRGLFELLFIEQVDSGSLLTDKFGFLDGEFLVSFELDFAGFLEGFLADEGGHFAEFARHLAFGKSWLARRGILFLLAFFLALIIYRKGYLVIREGMAL